MSKRQHVTPEASFWEVPSWMYGILYFLQCQRIQWISPPTTPHYVGIVYMELFHHELAVTYTNNIFIDILTLLFFLLYVSRPQSHACIIMATAVTIECKCKCQNNNSLSRITNLSTVQQMNDISINYVLRNLLLFKRRMVQWQHIYNG